VRYMYANDFAKVVNAIALYEDIVLYEAKRFADALCNNDDNFCTDALHDAINDDAVELGANEAKRACWRHADLRAAIDLYNDECSFDALCALTVAMLQRSITYQLAYT
jgi:hypothetical protein